jgi:hypothetical protein
LHLFSTVDQARIESNKLRRFEVTHTNRRGGK